MSCNSLPKWWFTYSNVIEGSIVSNYFGIVYIVSEVTFSSNYWTFFIAPMVEAWCVFSSILGPLYLFMASAKI